MRVAAAFKPKPYRTEPCGSASINNVFRPRRASATARLMAVVVFPTPPFWLTIARTLPTLLLCFFGYRFATAKRLQRRFRVTHPTLGLEARRRLGEECLEVLLGAGAIARFQEQERQSVVRTRQVRRELERTPVAANGL